MATHMYKQVMEENQSLINVARFLAITVDEVMAVDNCSFLFVHAYVV